MCGRYVSVTKIKEIEKRFGVIAPEPDLFTPNTNVSPGNYAPVITNEKPSELQFLCFGFSPFWAKKRMYVINARGEGDNNKENDPNFTGSKGIISKPMFRQSIRSKRCLVIADAFLEGPKKERLSKPYLVYLQEGRPFALAGIWDRWVNKETAEVIDSFAIITTTANKLLYKGIGHHRSPVILDRDDERVWLDSSLPLGEVTSMLRPYPSERMNAYPVGIDIKNPRANGMELLQPIGERIQKEYDYVIYEELKLEGMGFSQAKTRRKNNDDVGPIQGSLFD